MVLFHRPSWLAWASPNLECERTLTSSVIARRTSGFNRRRRDEVARTALQGTVSAPDGQCLLWFRLRFSSQHLGPLLSMYESAAPCQRFFVFVSSSAWKNQPSWDTLLVTEAGDRATLGSDPSTDFGARPNRGPECVLVPSIVLTSLGWHECVKPQGARGTESPKLISPFVLDILRAGRQFRS